MDIDSTNCKMNAEQSKPSTQKCKNVALVCENLVPGASYIFGLSALVTDASGEAIESEVRDQIFVFYR